uniref:Uncharacterized protein n=1 Tax=Solanum demissum TaxID=50514 RepID=Q0KIQ3_SOLDE|nr:hypothetical protein SDM1_34t00014 [Solanum demissum]
MDGGYFLTFSYTSGIFLALFRFENSKFKSFHHFGPTPFSAIFAPLRKRGNRRFGSKTCPWERRVSIPHPQGRRMASRSAQELNERTVHQGQRNKTTINLLVRELALLMGLIAGKEKWAGSGIIGLGRLNLERGWLKISGLLEKLE